MKLGTGLGLLALGVAVLGFWSHGHHAKRMESSITAAAAEVAAGSVHGAQAEVSGRDIHLTGILDGEEERDRLLAALDAVPGRRVVSAEGATVLEKVTPYTAEVSKAEGGALTASGHVPTEAIRGALAPALGEGAASLTLAAGAPADYAALASAGIAALGPMISGKAQLTDGTLEVSGKVLGPDEAKAVEAALAALPAGSVKTAVEMLDDGTPPAYELSYEAGTGATLAGKLAKGLDAGAIASALGINSLGGTTTTALLGEPGDLGQFGVLQSILPLVERLKLTVGEAGKSLDIGVQGGIDPGALAAKLQADLPDHAVTVATVTPTGENGQTRTNAANGVTERFMGGFWVGVPEVEVSKAGCQTAVEGYLGGSTINFLSGSDQLDASAIAVINGLAGIMARCVEEAGLKARIGGHTDNSGDPTANLGLSQRRATAVRRELVARGVKGEALVALGFGDTMPIADNATDEGKAKNRRTTIEWQE